MAQRESLPARVRRAFRLDLGRRRSREAEVDDEIRFHLEQRIAELLVGGWTRARAGHRGERDDVRRHRPTAAAPTQIRGAPGDDHPHGVWEDRKGLLTVYD